MPDNAVQGMRPPKNLEIINNTDVSRKWAEWQQQFKWYATAIHLSKQTNEVQAATLMTTIGMDAITIFNTFNLSDTEQTDIKVILQKFTDYFTLKINVTYERYTFNKMMQEENETFMEFLTRTQAQSKKCDFKEVNDSLLTDKIVIGVRSDQLREKLLSEDNLQLNKAINICKSSEQATKQMEVIKTKDATVHTLTKGKYHSKTKGNDHCSNNTFHCRRCGTIHEPRSCPAYGKACTKCNKKGHFGKQCRTRKTKTTNKIHVVDEGSGNDSNTDENMFINEITTNSDKDCWYEKVYYWCTKRTMGRICCVYQCPSLAKMPSHRFPKDEGLFNKWKSIVMSPKIRGLTDCELRKHSICYRHFTKNDYKSSGKIRKLKLLAIPTRNIPKEIEKCELPTTSIKEPHFPAHTINTIPEEEIYLKESRGILESATRRNRTYSSRKYLKKRNLALGITKVYKLASTLKKRQKYLRKQNFTFRQRLKEAKKYSKTLALQHAFSNLTSAQQEFIQMQIRTAKYKPKGRRFTLGEKILALSFWKQSGKAYRFMKDIFNMPSERTLRDLLKKITVHPGPMHFIKSFLLNIVEEMGSIHRVCCLMWDEVALQPHVDYNKHQKKIIGFEDFGTERRCKFADHALVFMVRGVRTGWKFPIGYYLCESATKTEQLVACIKEMTQFIIQCKLDVVAFVCDQAKPNIAAINKLKQETARQCSREGKCYRGTICLFNSCIIPFYDPPHLIKSVRNNLLTKDLLIGKDRRVSWDIIYKAYYMDNPRGIYKMMPKLTDRHIVKNRIMKMKVKLAAQVLSKTMASFIHHHTKIENTIDTEIGPLKINKKEGEDAADALYFFDSLFDSVNGHTMKPESKYRVVVSSKSPHAKFWQDALCKLRKMEFINKVQTKPKPKSKTLLHWSYTIQGHQLLWQKLQQKGFQFYKPRMINQDPLENFFGAVRSLGHRNVNPSCIQFQNNFKILLINNLTTRHTIGRNCESKCDGQLLFTLKQFLNEIIEPPATDELTNISNIFQGANIDSNASDPEEYVSGWIARKLLRNNLLKNCQTCKNILLLPETSESTNVIKSREFSKEKSCLSYPTTRLSTKFTAINNYMSTLMPDICFKKEFNNILKTSIFMQFDFSWMDGCEIHANDLKDLFVEYVTTFFIYTWCKRMNNILNGSRENFLQTDAITKMALKKIQTNRKYFR